MKRTTAISKIYISTLAIIGWFALAAQLYLSITNRTVALGENLIRYFSYFTILTNLIVAACCSAVALSASLAKGFFIRYTTLTATGVYILVVGIIYNLILRGIWSPQGLQRVVDELLHTVIPALYLAWWVLFSAKHPLRWTKIFAWLIYPMVYLAVVLVRGFFSDFYPYPFIDAGKLNTPQLLRNIAGVGFSFAFLSLIFILAGNAMYKKNAV